MGVIRLLLATWVAKLTRFLVRLLRLGGGSSLPGLLALWIDPDYIQGLASKLARAVLVTGTNGKTTTSSLLTAILRREGQRVAHNTGGSNLLRGVATALAADASLLGKVRARVGVFEVDEATMPEAVAALTPKVIVVSNLFRDQLDRYGEIDKTAAILRSALTQAPQAQVVLCADDPLVCSLGEGRRQVHYFGIEEPGRQSDELRRATDAPDCPRCGTALEYEANYYGGLGIWRCPEGDLTRPKPAVQSGPVSLRGLSGSTLTLDISGEKAELSLPLPGLYNVHNALAAAATASLLGIAPPAIRAALEEGVSLFGRIEQLDVEGRRVAIVLIKNPAGANQALELLRTEPGQKHLLLALNDNFADGTDISWIWDTDYERVPPEVSRIWASGQRAPELTLRLKYAGVKSDLLREEGRLIRAFRAALRELPAETPLFILPTYTALLDLHAHLRRRGASRAFWREGE